MNKGKAAGLCLFLAGVVLLGSAAWAIAPPRWVAALYVDAQKTVGLRWMAVSGATEYQILRSTTEGKDHKKIATVVSPQHFDHEVKPGTTYYYILKSIAGGEVSAPSEEKSVAIPGQKKKKAQKPPEIDNLEVTSTTEFGKKANRADVGWKPVDGAIAYNVYRSTEPGKDYVMVTSTSDDKFVDNSVEEGKKYYYRVTALDESFQETKYSEERSAEIRSPRKKKAKRAKPDPSRIVEKPDWKTMADIRGLETEGDIHEANKGRPCSDCHIPSQSGVKGTKWNFDSVPEHRGLAADSECTRCHDSSKKAEKPEAKEDTSELMALRGEDIPIAEKPSAPSSRPAPAATAPRSGKHAVSAPPPPLPKPVPEPPPPPLPKPKEFRKQEAMTLAASLPVNRQRSGTSPDPTYSSFGESFDEVWVVQRISKDVVPEAGETWPGSGELRAVVPDRDEVPLPLKHTDVAADISGYIARVKVTQQYQNPYDSKIEAVYVFPLPQNAAVSEFIMQIGDRRIRGIIREREEAQRIYREAKRQGYTASLLTQERPNIFTQKVANIEPGRDIDIEVTYFNTLSYSEGEYTFVFPMVVGPRYNPPGYTDGVGAVGRGRAGASGQRTEVQYLRPDERSGHDIMVTVDLDAGVALEKAYSNSHAIEVKKKGRTAARFRLRPSDTIPNKDFVLRYQVAGKEVKSALMTDRDERGGYFTLMLQPPKNLSDLPRTGMEMVFVIDTSGSMRGWPTVKAKAVLRRALKNLEPHDTFQIVRFAGDASTFVPVPVAATTGNIEQALSWLNDLRSSGGTQMIRGIQRALDFPHDNNRLRIVSFLTDGYIGNESQIFEAVAAKLGPARIFSFGIGNSVNRYLIEGLARLGHGAVAYVLTGDSDHEAVDLFYDRIRHPALTDISIDWGGMEVTDLYPARIPDLFVGRPVIITGRFRGHGDKTVRVKGRVAGENQSIDLRVALDDREGRHAGISRIWARARIAELSDTLATGGPADLRDRIRETALTYSLMSPYTAFVAVDSTRRTAGSHGTTVHVPVPVPQGVRYDTTVME